MNKFSIVILKKSNITDFAKERNLLLKKSKKDWVMFVDSDEEISSDFKKEIEQKIQNTKYSSYYVYRKNYFLGTYSGTDKIIRLVKKGSGKWQRSVHEIFVPNKSSATGVINKVLVHNTASDLHTFIDKINYYSTLHAKENLKLGRRSNLIKIVFYPLFKFIQSLIMRRGVAMSIMQSFHSFLSWTKEWELQNA